MAIIEVSMEHHHLIQVVEEMRLPCTRLELLEEATEKEEVITTDQENHMDLKVLEGRPRVPTKEEREEVAIIIGKIETTKEDQATEVVE